MEKGLEVSDRNNKIGEAQRQEQILTLQRMRELEKEINVIQQEKKQTIKDIIRINNVELTPKLKLNEAYIVELENEQKELSYELYSEHGLIGRSNEEGLIILDSDYITQMDEKFGQYGAEYLIPTENKSLDPNLLQEQSTQLYRYSSLEQEQQGIEAITQGKRKEENPDKTVSQMEDDLGCDISSCVRIEDEDFSQEVLGHQTGHQEKYIAYSRSRNTFLLIGQSSSNKFEEIKDICGAEGGGQAAEKTYLEYDEQGNPVEIESPSFVMERRDGIQGALALDMRYGEICVSNLTPTEHQSGKYVSEEMNIGHSIRPTPDEIELKKRTQKEREKALAMKEEEVKKREQELEEGNTSKNDLSIAKKELSDMKSKAQDDDDDYDWSTGRPIPRH